MNIEVYTRREPKDDEYSVKSLEPLYYAYDAAWRTKWEMAIIENSARICSESDWMEKLEDEEHAIREMNHRMSGDSDFIPINEDYLNKLDPEDRHWLPTDIYVNSDGSVEFKSYISNLHPGKYPEAYKSIGTVITKCLPALEQVLTDWEHRRDLRVPYDPDEYH
ncbi:hypothetical protein GGI15_004912 [Coemansia interrupta]|uniref:DUF4246 domain-containing protein n=1 Tax=Coemansia interrupta TaxID=1126814 RepID=A0A9W8H816_9FUNG|nr:hypothetical protein GGI15_004912 [Coemansia interrupta]